MRYLTAGNESAEHEVRGNDLSVISLISIKHPHHPASGLEAYDLEGSGNARLETSFAQRGKARRAAEARLATATRSERTASGTRGRGGALSPSGRGRGAAEHNKAEEAERRKAARKEAARTSVTSSPAPAPAPSIIPAIPTKEPKRTEAERKEAERKEAERKEAECKEAERKEAERKEAECKDAERKDAERKEAERKEAERKEAERKEAEGAERTPNNASAWHFAVCLFSFFFSFPLFFWATQTPLITNHSP